MDQTGIKPEVLVEIENIAKKYNVNRILLFGSRARGDYKRTSDINLDRAMQKELYEVIKREGIVIYEKI